MKYVLTILLLATICSCASYERCVDKYGRVSSDSIKKAVELIVPRDSMITRLQISNIPYLLPGDTVLVEDTASRAKIRYWRSMYEDALMIQADCDSVVVRDTIYIPPPPVLEPPPPGTLEKVWRDYKIVSGVLLPLLIFLFVLVIKRR